jgi:hypothetical protein
LVALLAVRHQQRSITEPPAAGGAGKLLARPTTLLHTCCWRSAVAAAVCCVCVLYQLSKRGKGDATLWAHLAGPSLLLLLLLLLPGLQALHTMKTAAGTRNKSARSDQLCVYVGGRPDTVAKPSGYNGLTSQHR